LIVDSSVLLDAFIETPFTPKAIALFSSTEELSAPDHLRIEAPGALARAVRRGDIDAGSAQRIYRQLGSFMPHLEPSADLSDRAFALSLELTHPFYDCLFLALAERRATQLVTLDRRFVRKLAQTSYARHVLHLTEWSPPAPEG
jgi:predicted nucleic acid-binding protein